MLKFAMSLVVTAATLLALEFAVFPLALPRLPLNVQPFLPEEVAVLAQSSKAGTIPQDYVALTGDSYAQGLGDWLHSLGRLSNGPFHSAHVLHELSGRDVISLGRGGGGSITGIVFRPLDYFVRLHSVGRLMPGPPETLVAYFYEGNDLLDTLLELALLTREARSGKASDTVATGMLKPSSPLFADALANHSLTDPASLRSFIEDSYKRRSAGVADHSTFDSLYFLRFVSALAQRRGSELFPAAAAPGATRRWEIGTRGPRVRVNGRELNIPEALQTPAMEINEAETNLALDAFAASLSVLIAQPEAQNVCVVYIPSPLSVYELITLPSDADSDSAPAGSPRQKFNMAEVRARSAYIREQVGQMTRERGVLFVDATPAITNAAQEYLLHGPRDWRHLNERGYRLLASEALRCLRPAQPLG